MRRGLASGRKPADPLGLFLKGFVGRVRDANVEGDVAPTENLGVVGDVDRELPEKFAGERDDLGQLRADAQPHDFRIHLGRHSRISQRQRYRGRMERVKRMRCRADDRASGEKLVLPPIITYSPKITISWQARGCKTSSPIGMKDQLQRRGPFSVRPLSYLELARQPVGRGRDKPVESINAVQHLPRNLIHLSPAVMGACCGVVLDGRITGYAVARATSAEGDYRNQREPFGGAVAI